VGERRTGHENELGDTGRIRDFSCGTNAPMRRVRTRRERDGDVGLRVRICKGVTFGRSGLRFNTRLGKTYLSTGRSGTLIAGKGWRYWAPNRSRSPRAVNGPCQGTTKAGAPCANAATLGMTCRIHAAQAPAIQARTAAAAAARAEEKAAEQRRRAEERTRLATEANARRAKWRAEHPHFGTAMLAVLLLFGLIVAIIALASGSGGTAPAMTTTTLASVPAAMVDTTTTTSAPRR
jgi:hypothetical protein